MFAISAWQIATKLIPAIRAFTKALKKNSDGGKKITPAERDEILGALMGKLGGEFEDIIDRHNENAAREGLKRQRHGTGQKPDDKG